MRRAKGGEGGIPYLWGRELSPIHHRPFPTQKNIFPNGRFQERNGQTINTIIIPQNKGFWTISVNKSKRKYTIILTMVLIGTYTKNRLFIRSSQRKEVDNLTWENCLVSAL